MSFTLKNLTDLVALAVEHDASDIHIRSNEAPSIRIAGEIVTVKTKIFSQSNTVDICEILLESGEKGLDLTTVNERDGSFTFEGMCRVRFNIFRYQGKLGIVLRIIKTVIPTIEELQLPSVVPSIAEIRRGLVLVTGPTGSGKSTTLASIVEKINNIRTCHIITIEDPVEYLFEPKLCKISQREIGKDTATFSIGLRSALRQDPDVIMIGEMRDTETVSTALKAAETGHAVFSTLHTTDALVTIGRIISMFPAEEQQEVRERLAGNLSAVLCQRMLTSTSNKRVVAMEVMKTSPGIKKCILGEDELSNIYTYIKAGKGKGGNGSQTFDQHITRLFEKGLITKEVAKKASGSSSDFEQQLLIERGEK